MKILLNVMCLTLGILLMGLLGCARETDEAEKVSVEEQLKTVERILAQGPFKPDWESLKNFQVPEWYQDAKFGIFIHWGLYSVPAFGNEWYPRHMYKQGSREFEHHVATFGSQAEFG